MVITKIQLIMFFATEDKEAKYSQHKQDQELTVAQIMYSFSYLEPVCCSMYSSNCCFLTCIQVSEEASQVVWYSHLF